MILTDTSALLFIEPTAPPKYGRAASKKYAWFHALLVEQQQAGQIGCYRNQVFELGVCYLGHHTCSCGEASTGYDILLPNHTATNSLAYHYLCYHTIEIPLEEWKKLEELRRFVLFRIETKDKME